MRTVYVAGPYSTDPGPCTLHALAVGSDLLDAGIAPYVPHLSHYWHQAFPRGYEDWMRLDFAWVKKCDALLRLPGISPGADREVALANEIGIPVFSEVDDVIAWARRAA